jgi:peptidoglycan/xylan/chitin deacetylase (PgdA/CDA1 family)
MPRLTFDDGPDPVYTPQILEVLARHGVRATFFCVGEAARRQPALVRRIAAEGHTVGHHSLTHPRPSATGLPALISDWRAGRAAVRDALGAAPGPFRPPYGELGRRGAIAAALLRLDPVFWDVDPGDWKPEANADAIAAAIRAAGPDDVVLLHDGSCDPVEESCRDRSATVAALRSALVP